MIELSCSFCGRPVYRKYNIENAIHTECGVILKNLKRRSEYSKAKPTQDQIRLAKYRDGYLPLYDWCWSVVKG